MLYRLLWGLLCFVVVRAVVGNVLGFCCERPVRIALSAIIFYDYFVYGTAGLGVFDFVHIYGHGVFMVE